ncbi:hypothetical protein EDC96DRAFT_501116 [Choanephora cucurbitarum]|nr:hypothetical protein EDC96DRAFT_501116 [Choanephora cucurbitarum]
MKVLFLASFVFFFMTKMKCPLSLQPKKRVLMILNTSDLLTEKYRKRRKKAEKNFQIPVLFSIYTDNFLFLYSRHYVSLFRTRI